MIFFSSLEPVSTVHSLLEADDDFLLSAQVVTSIRDKGPIGFTVYQRTLCCLDDEESESASCVFSSAYSSKKAFERAIAVRRRGGRKEGRVVASVSSVVRRRSGWRAGGRAGGRADGVVSPQLLCENRVLPGGRAGGQTPDTAVLLCGPAGCSNGVEEKRKRERRCQQQQQQQKRE
jgi:hypothetical protein